MFPDPNELSVIRRWVGNSKQWLRTFLSEVESNPSIISVIAMGSAVRERGHRRSDFDLLILYRGERPKFDAPIEVDIRAYPIDRVDEQVLKGHEIVCWALNFGFPLYDPKNVWQHLLKRWKNNIPLPSQQEAMKRGIRSLKLAKDMLTSGDDSAAGDLVLAALTQFARARLIEKGIFPASRPELPSQLKAIHCSDELARVLEEAMYQDVPSAELVRRAENLIDT